MEMEIADCELSHDGGGKMRSRVFGICLARQELKVKNTGVVVLNHCPVKVGSSISQGVDFGDKKSRTGETLGCMLLFLCPADEWERVEDPNDAVQEPSLHWLCRVKVEGWKRGPSRISSGESVCSLTVCCGQMGGHVSAWARFHSGSCSQNVRSGHCIHALHTSTLRH